ncbi:MAG: OsmC family protein [Gemmatimonadota bacterium]|nr:OsmC family protein [Gemmatimonadota bacterium]
MLGTLNGALGARGIRLDPEDIVAEVEGINRLEEGIPLLREIVVHYRLRIPAGSRDTVDRALERHASKCPTARSLAGAIEVSWTADITEKSPAGDGPG